MTFYQILGKFHPLIVHFPVAFITMGSVAEVSRIFNKSSFLIYLPAFLFTTGSIAAIFAGVTGWAFASQMMLDGPEKALLEWHRWMGTATILFSAIAATITWIWRREEKGSKVTLRTSLAILSALILIPAAHQGAMLVWGTDFLKII